MIMTDLQYAALTISLSTLGQTDLAGNDPEGLRTLEYLLEQALANVRKAAHRAAPDAPDIARRFNDP
jgi:hypothetical protein